MDKAVINRLYDDLAPLGFFKYATAEEERWARTGAADYGLWAQEGLGRIYVGDAEAIAEGGACDFLGRVEPFLQHEGVSALPCSQDWTPEAGEYVIQVNGRRFTMYSGPDFGENPLWVAAPARAFLLVEQLLNEAGSSEHIYTLRGQIAESNPAIFLTEEMRDLIDRSPLVPEYQRLLSAAELAAALL